MVRASSMISGTRLASERSASIAEVDARGLGRARSRPVAVPAPRLPARARGLGLDRPAAVGLDAGATCSPSDGARLVGAVAAFVKTHSYGEYIFDWGWANAAQRAGMPLLPQARDRRAGDAGDRARGSCSRRASARRRSGAALIAAVRALADDAECSSIHWLFCTADEQAALARARLLRRARRYQFHWQNRGYRDVRRLPRRAQEPQAQAAAQGARARAGRDRAARVARGRRARPGAARRPRSLLSRDHRQPRRPRLPAPGLLPPARRDAARRDAHGRGRAATASAIAGALFLETDARALRPLLGRRRRTSICSTSRPRTTRASSARSRSSCRCSRPARRASTSCCAASSRAPTYSAHWIRHPGLAAAIDDFSAREARAIAREMQELAASGPFRAAGEPD